MILRPSPILLIFFIYPFLVFGVDETLTGKLVFSDAATGDLDSDLEISYNLSLEFELDVDGGRRYKGFSGRFKGIMDGACHKLQLRLNRSLCEGKAFC